MRWSQTLWLGLIVLTWWFIQAEKDRTRGQEPFPYREYYRRGYFAPALYNNLIERYSDHITPFIPLCAFPSHERLTQHWRTIRAEALQVMRQAVPAGEWSRFFTHFQEPKWKAVPLFWYGQTYPENLQQCPITARILHSLPQVKAAMFSIMEPGTIVYAHRGPFRGCLRAHLGLVVPEDRANCWIQVDDLKYVWQEGELQLFDDTFTHCVKNQTSQTRIILFLDLERPLTGLLQWINRVLIQSPLPRWLSMLNNKQEQRAGL